MKENKNILALLLLLIIVFPLQAQDTIQRNCSINGYLTNMQSLMFRQWKGDWLSNNLVNNRLNFRCHNTSNVLNVAIEIRNQFISGESVKIIPGYAESLDTDNGLFHLSNNISKGKSYVLNSKIDRAYIDYSKNKLQLRIGRQRINWGQCFVWNPNDLFNTYSFFDFDYLEKPGSDAFRVQYFSSSTSTFELAVKADNNNRITSAALYRFNKWNYDIQFIGGLFNECDYVIGCGWSGNVKGASFTGEISYFQPKNNLADTSGGIAAVVGSNYMFKNSFTLQFEILYNQLNSNIAAFTDYYNMEMSPKNLSISNITIVLKGYYPVTPLFNTSLSIMYFPKLSGFFVGPTISYSLTDNIDFSLITQSFAGQITKGKTEYYHFGFLRLKWNF